MEPEWGDVQDVARGEYCLVRVSLLETGMKHDGVGREDVEGRTGCARLNI